MPSEEARGSRCAKGEGEGEGEGERLGTVAPNLLPPPHLHRWNSGRAFFRASGTFADYINATQARAARDGRRKHADKAIRFFHKE